MSAPSADRDSSHSSSGFEDGLGRRVLEFDRETGGMLERIVLRPELSAFEKAIVERLAIVAGLEDERFPRPRVIETHGERLTVVSDYLAGRRLSDIIDCAADHGIVAGLDAALGLLLEILPALSRLHDAGLAYGALAPGRIMITPAGQIGLLDAIYAEPLERLQLTRKRLWAELRLAFPPTAGVARFDKGADLAHASMVAATLTVGRALQDKDYPEGITVLRQEIHEIASIRGSKSFADAVDKYFAATLPLAGRRSAPTADEAAIDLRKLVRKELGINTCRTAWLEFLQQVETADAERTVAEAAERDQRIAAAADAVRAEAARKQWHDTDSAPAPAERPHGRRADKAEAARAEAERVERERAEQARLHAEQRERERLEAERAEAERRERERLEAERAEKERRERERAEQARLDAERLERERLEADRRERERLEAERLERDRIEAERREQERIEAARIEAERRERERLEAERRERERLEAERLERERIERERLEAERRERERLEAERRERERLEAERLEQERIEKARLEAERLERERLEAERRERERLEAERLERERLERERLEAERRERERLEAERRERERLEAERLEKERIEKARLEAERIERERIEAERRERERLEAERRERLEAERRERERLEAERREKERAEKARVEAERLERERLDKERAEKARVEAEKRERERLEKERAEKARLEAERLEKERAEKARLDAEQRERERLESEQRERVRLETERAAKEAREQAERLEKKRAEERRAREDAERAAREEETEGEAAAAPARQAPATSKSGWLIPPNRAASFEPVASEPTPAPAARPYPIYVAPPEPAPAWIENPPAEQTKEEFLAALSAPAPVAGKPAAIPIRLKVEDDRPAPVARVEHRRDPVEEPVSSTEVYEPFRQPEERRPIPWKWIAAGVVLAAGAFAVSRGYTPNTAPVVDTVRKVIPSSTPTELPPVAANVGRLIITTQPPGARVTLDGKPAGETPLTIDGVKPGRHVIAITGTEGSARRTVRVEGGQALAVDIPLYSGFAAISIPFVVNVSEGGKALGTSENQILLGPGRHTLRLVNKELEYNATETIEITSGEVTRLDLDPKGTANINAAPWAEVWIDGEKAGETPLANVPIRLGVREIVFKNPQFPERKQTLTVTAGSPTTISVDFIK